MDNKDAKHFSRREERVGTPPLSELEAQHTTAEDAVNALAAKSEENVKAALESAADKVIAMPTREEAAPQVQSQLTITLFKDGNAQVNGPFEDRILYHGLLAIAGDVERMMYMNKVGQLQRQAVAQAQALAKEPFWKRVMRERKEKKEAAKRDELAKALEANK